MISSECADGPRRVYQAVHHAHQGLQGLEPARQGATGLLSRHYGAVYTTSASHWSIVRAHGLQRVRPGWQTRRRCKGNVRGTGVSHTACARMALNSPMAASPLLSRCHSTKHSRYRQPTALSHTPLAAASPLLMSCYMALHSPVRLSNRMSAISSSRAPLFSVEREHGFEARSP